MPNTGPSTVKGLEKKQVGCHQKVLGKGAHKQGLRFTLRFTTEFQEGWGMSPEYSGPAMSSWKSERVPDVTMLISLPALKSGVRVSFSWKTTEGLLSLTKQRRKHLQKTLSWKELRFCLLKTSRAQDISDSRVCICLTVQGVSEVFLNTNRILGQPPVRRDGSQTQIVGNRLKKPKQQMST